LTKKTPYKGLGADSEEKHEPVSDIDTVVDSLKALDPKRSQKGCMNWANYRKLLIAFPLPEPVIHQAWRQ
jgi:hypothetical protein